MSDVQSIARPRITMGQAFLPVMQCRDPFILIESPRGCLKTCSNLHILMMRAAQWPGKRWYIWRSTRALLSTTVLPSFEEYVIPVWQSINGMRLMNPAARPTQRSEYIFENGTVFLPVGLDDVLRGTSAEGAGGYLAEAVELESRDQAAALVGMMRQPGVPYHQILVDVNPGAPTHWTNSAAEPVPPKLRRVETREDYARLQAYNRRAAANPNRQWKRIVAKIMDNPFYFDVHNWKLTRAGAAYLKSLGTLTGHLYARWVLGEWTAAEGAVFPEFKEARHVITPRKLPEDWPVIWGTDPGFDHPTGILWIKIAPNGTLYVIDEVKRGGLSVAEHAGNVLKREEGQRLNIIARYGDPHHAFNRTAQSKTTIAEQWQTHGLSLWRWPIASTKPDLEAQVEAVREYLRTDRLKFFSTCTEAISEMQSWSYKRSASGQMLAGDDQFEDKNNDLIDVLKGLIATKPIGGNSKPIVITGGEDETNEADFVDQMMLQRITPA